MMPFELNESDLLDAVDGETQVAVVLGAKTGMRFAVVRKILVVRGEGAPRFYLIALTRDWSAANSIIRCDGFGGWDIAIVELAELAHITIADFDDEEAAA